MLLSAVLSCGGQRRRDRRRGGREAADGCFGPARRTRQRAVRRRGLCDSRGAGHVASEFRGLLSSSLGSRTVRGLSGRDCGASRVCAAHRGMAGWSMAGGNVTALDNRPGGPGQGRSVLFGLAFALDVMAWSSGDRWDRDRNGRHGVCGTALALVVSAMVSSVVAAFRSGGPGLRRVGVLAMGLMEVQQRAEFLLHLDLGVLGASRSRLARFARGVAQRFSSRRLD